MRAISIAYAKVAFAIGVGVRSDFWGLEEELRDTTKKFGNGLEREVCKLSGLPSDQPRKRLGPNMADWIY